MPKTPKDNQKRKRDKKVRDILARGAIGRANRKRRGLKRRTNPKIGGELDKAMISIEKGLKRKPNKKRFDG